MRTRTARFAVGAGAATNLNVAGSPSSMSRSVSGWREIVTVGNEASTVTAKFCEAANRSASVDDLLSAAVTVIVARPAVNAAIVRVLSRSFRLTVAIPEGEMEAE